MNDDSKAARKRERAARLRREADNCVSAAVTITDTGHAADLIDEAVRLARRSSELGGDETPSPDSVPSDDHRRTP